MRTQVASRGGQADAVAGSEHARGGDTNGGAPIVPKSRDCRRLYRLSPAQTRWTGSGLSRRSRRRSSHSNERQGPPALGRGDDRGLAGEAEPRRQSRSSRRRREIRGWTHFGRGLRRVSPQTGAGSGTGEQGRLVCIGAGQAMFSAQLSTRAQAAARDSDSGVEGSRGRRSNPVSPTEVKHPAWTAFSQVRRGFSISGECTP